MKTFGSAFEAMRFLCPAIRPHDPTPQPHPGLQSILHLLPWQSVSNKQHAHTYKHQPAAQLTFTLFVRY